MDGIHHDRDRFERALMQNINRRGLLASGGAAALAVAISLPGRPTHVFGQGTPGASPVANGSALFLSTPFTLGVASGDPLPDGVVLWTRLAPTPLGGGGMDPVPYEVRWEIARDDAFREIIQSGTAIASPTLAHSVHVDVTGLAPATEYYYRFMVGNEVSPTGRTKTAPAIGAPVDSFRFAHASCSHYEQGYFTAYGDMAAQQFDLIVHLGDYIYEGGASTTGEQPRQHNSDEILTLSDYRNRHALYKTDANLQAAHASAPWATTWDDHEVDNNWASEISENFDPTEVFLARRAAAFQAYYEHLPLRPSSMPTGPHMQLYRKLTFGNLAEMQVLDTRQYRTDQPCGDELAPRCAEAVDPNMTLTGPDQERWLLQNLDASQATWNILGQQVMMGQFTIQAPGEPAGFNLDQWDGYPAARNRILQHLSSRGIANPVVLTGDIHSAWVHDLKMDFDDPSSATVGTELVSTSVTSGFLSANGDATPDEAAQYAPLNQVFLATNPHIRYFDPAHRGYVANELTPETWTAAFRTCEAVTVEDAPVETQVTYVIEAGQAGAQEA